jgi:4-hydroxy-tetrahydrodipicolinate reductase
MTAICVAGVTGWVGEPLARAVIEADDLSLVGAVARSAAGQKVEGSDVTISGSVEEALDAARADVLIDYTAPGAVRGHAEAALRRGVGVVVGTSGLTADDYAELDAIARESGVGLIAAGNFSVMAAVLFHSALRAAEELEAWEVIDYADDGKPDAPSGTARELAERLSGVRTPKPTASGDQLIGPPEARGARIGTTQVHSLRLPSFVVSTEVVFGGPDERLSLRHDAGGSADPYIGGTLLAARAVVGRVGVTRGLDRLLFGE